MKPLELKKVPAALHYIRYRMIAGTLHDVHSPFVFDLYKNVIKDETPFYSFTLIESVRSKMELSEEKIAVHDLGTGGKRIQNKKRSIRFIAKHHIKSAKYAQLLFRLVNYFHPMQILELGTSLGITTMYLASPFRNARVTTMEGCPNIASVANRNFKDAGIENIGQIIGEFSEVLPEFLKKVSHLDFVYFDGNHRKESTLDYFRQCLSKHHEHSVFVFDDIHWNDEMTEAWKIIQADQAVTMTIDLFSLGIVFFRRGFPKQHFVLKY